MADHPYCNLHHNFPELLSHWCCTPYNNLEALGSKSNKHAWNLPFAHPPLHPIPWNKQQNTYTEKEQKIKKNKLKIIDNLKGIIFLIFFLHQPNELQFNQFKSTMFFQIYTLFHQTKNIINLMSRCMFYLIK